MSSTAGRPDDTRTDDEKRTALFDFVYQTYDSSAWIPQSLFDGNLATQAIVGDVNTIVRDKVGLVLWRDNRECRHLAWLRATRPRRAAEVDGQLHHLSHG